MEVQKTKDGCHCNLCMYMFDLLQEKENKRARKKLQMKMKSVKVRAS